MTPTQATTIPPQTAECPECAARVAATATLAGEILDCPECGVELEVRNLAPFTLAVAPTVEEDWGE